MADPESETLPPVRVPGARIALSTASVFPESTGSAFELAGQLGYDAVEVMVGFDPISQDIDAIRQLSEQHGVPVCAVHAPCLLITQRVWGSDPWAKLEKSGEMASTLGASVVVVHPPFRWQREYARDFVDGIARLERKTGIAFAVENMYPWRAPRRELQAYAPGWNPVEHDYANVTVDLSHSATAGVDGFALARELGDRLRHVHLTDGSGSAKDEHLVPGRGDQRCDELLEYLAERGFGGSVVVEINTRRAESRAERFNDLAESLTFAQLHLAVAEPSYLVAADGTVSQNRRRRPARRVRDGG
jgi:sugar phosphate isomerase/epimerase